MANKERVFNEEEINEKLNGVLVHWYYERGWIRRKYKTMDDILDPIFNLDNKIINILQWIGKRS